MRRKIGIIKKIFKIAIVFAIFECLYLYALPPVLNHYLPENLLKNQAEKYTNASFNYSDYKISNVDNELIPNSECTADKLWECDTYISCISAGGRWQEKYGGYCR